jgi:ATP-dependent DNA helicase Rep
VTEGVLPFKRDDKSAGKKTNAETAGGSTMADEMANEKVATDLQEERRLMYVGITRAQRSLSVSWTKRRKKGREMIAAQPSRFIGEMALNLETTKEDPREKLRLLRAEFAKKAAEANAVDNMIN